MPLMAQYVTVTCLLLLYSGRERHMLVFVVAYVTCMLLLLLGVMPSHVIDLLQVLSIPLTAVSKVRHLCTCASVCVLDDDWAELYYSVTQV